MGYGKNKDGVTKLKRKTPAHMFPKKFCLWCGNEITRKRHTLTEWSKVQTCTLSCASYWSHHHKPLSEMPIVPSVKQCLYCKSTMTKRENEHPQAWAKRQYCNKSHAAYDSLKPKTSTKTKPVESLENHLGLIRYTPGTPEFNAIAALYQ